MDNKLIILCGPSGSGKTTIAKHLLKHLPILDFSISATTREPRAGEKHGKDYYFLKVEDFEEKIRNKEFVEYEQVYPGLLYGTLKSEMERIWNSGKIPVLDIDVIGALNVKRDFAPKSLAVFIHPMSIENIRKRLHHRATENEESYNKRVARAIEELEYAAKCDKVVFNEALDKALKETESLILDYISE